MFIARLIFKLYYDNIQNPINCENSIFTNGVFKKGKFEFCYLDLSDDEEKHILTIELFDYNIRKWLIFFKFIYYRVCNHSDSKFEYLIEELGKNHIKAIENKIEREEQKILKMTINSKIIFTPKKFLKKYIKKHECLVNKKLLPTITTRISGNINETNNKAFLSDSTTTFKLYFYNKNLINDITNLISKFNINNFDNIFDCQIIKDNNKENLKDPKICIVNTHPGFLSKDEIKKYKWKKFNNPHTPYSNESFNIITELALEFKLQRSDFKFVIYNLRLK